MAHTIPWYPIHSQDLCYSIKITVRMSWARQKSPSGELSSRSLMTFSRNEQTFLVPQHFISFFSTDFSSHYHHHWRFSHQLLDVSPFIFVFNAEHFATAELGFFLEDGNFFTFFSCCCLILALVRGVNDNWLKYGVVEVSFSANELLAHSMGTTGVVRESSNFQGGSNVSSTRWRSRMRKIMQSRLFFLFFLFFIYKEFQFLSTHTSKESHDEIRQIRQGSDTLLTFSTNNSEL